MRRPLASSIAVAVALTIALTVPGAAGPEKIAFPADWKKHVLYTTVDRYDVKQYRELYASSEEAVTAMKEGKPLPQGTVLTLVQYKAQVDAAGQPVKDANGRFVKGDLIAYTVMEKRAGWGTEYPPEWRNGEWEYAAFGPDMKLNEKANYKGCFQCHKPHEATDFVISQTKIAVAAATGQITAGDVNIVGFTFGPAKLSVETGRPIVWTNSDDSPHQVTFTKTQERSPVLAKGQSHTAKFDAPGTYDYICGLHPQMKGTVEVK